MRELLSMSHFTLDDIVKILSHAKSLEAYELEQEALTSLNRSMTTKAQIDRETLYQMAQDEGLSAKYVDKALTLYFPSREQKIEDLKKVGGVFSFEAMAKEYGRTLRKILEVHFPHEEFLDEYKYDYGYMSRVVIPVHKATVYRIKTSETKTGLFKKKTVKRYQHELWGQILLFINHAGWDLDEKNRILDWGGDPIRILARVDMYVPKDKCRLEIGLYDPRLLNVCGKTIEELNEWCKEQIDTVKIICQYSL